MKAELNYIWAKYSASNSFYPLYGHLLDTAVAGKVLFENWLRSGLRELLGEALGENPALKTALVCGLHDIGKANPVFQDQKILRLTAKEPSGEMSSKLQNIEKNFAKIPPDFCKTLERRLAGLPVIRRHEQVSALQLSHKETGFLGANFHREWLAAIALGHHGQFFQGTSKWTGSGQGMNGWVKYDTEERDICDTAPARNTGWKEAREDIIAIIEAGCGVKLSELPETLDPVSIILLSGLTVVADRLASSEIWVRQQQDLMRAGKLSGEKPTEWIRNSYERMLEHCRKELGLFDGLKNPQEEILGGWDPRPAQSSALQAKEGLVCLMSGTGSGKTEAAVLRHSLANERLIFLLPTQATTNAIMRRMQKLFSASSNVASLAHGQAILEEFYNQPFPIESEDEPDSGSRGLYPTDFVKSKSARLLAPLCVATIDQAALAGLPQKWTHLRLLALANAHIVMDEVHTLDAYQTELFKPILRWLGATRTRVTLLSATMPINHLNQFAHYYRNSPLDEDYGLSESVSFPAIAEVLPPAVIPNRDAGEPETAEASKQPVSVRPLQTVERDEFRMSYQLTESTDFISSHVEWWKQQRKAFPKARLGIFLNTIDRAQQVGKELIEQGENVLVLHSRMTAAHRSVVEENLQKLLGAGGQGESLTLVGTQTIEASLDIDLDAISTDIAPAPSLIQRAGRAWRRQDPSRKDRASGLNGLTVHIVSGKIPDGSEQHNEEVWWVPYPFSPIRGTLDWLHHRPSEKSDHIEFPLDAQSFVESSWVDLYNLETPDDLDYAAKNSLDREKARNWGRPLKNWLDGDSCLNDLASLTNQEVDAEGDSPLTRLSEIERTRILLCGFDESIPGIWTESVEDLQSLRKEEIGKVKQALRAVVSVTSKKILRKLQQDPGKVYLTQPAMLYGTYIINVSAPDSVFSYDPVFGLQLRDLQE